MRNNAWSVHTDAAWNSTSGNCGMGWHFKDTLATPAGTYSSTRRSVSSALVAEALACINSLKRQILIAEEEANKL
ncbi:hypothetical protein HID58_025233 [Brassica napus]|uniref:Uncharacterized protein n=1 Tax=Brassica napus TaxID=3708 RepID=A0ABQ8CLV9_BRANA|nr:hypothetical protein HID58_025233 [Brassica napus]